MSAPSQAILPEHYFRTLCQNTGCRTALGGFHIPTVGGVAIFACHRCQHVSVFRNEAFGITAHLLDRKGKVVASGQPMVVTGAAGSGAQSR